MSTDWDAYSAMLRERFGPGRAVRRERPVDSWVEVQARREELAKVTGLRPHVFHPDVSLPPDFKGRQPCLCSLFEDNKIHQVPETPPEVAEVEARRMGEGDA